jgi:hypothetical protein
MTKKEIEKPIGDWYRHYKNHKLYAITDFCKIQVHNKWVEAIIYTDETTEPLFCRSAEEFHIKFKKVHNIVTGEK